MLCVLYEPLMQLLPCRAGGAYLSDFFACKFAQSRVCSRHGGQMNRNSVSCADVQVLYCPLAPMESGSRRRAGVRLSSEPPMNARRKCGTAGANPGRSGTPKAPERDWLVMGTMSDRRPGRFARRPPRLFPHLCSCIGFLYFVGPNILKESCMISEIEDFILSHFAYKPLVGVAGRRWKDVMSAHSCPVPG